MELLEQCLALVVEIVCPSTERCNNIRDSKLQLALESESTLNYYL